MSSNYRNRTLSPLRTSYENSCSVSRRTPRSMGKEKWLEERDNVVKIIVDVKSDVFRRDTINPDDITVIKRAGKSSRPLLNRQEMTCRNRESGGCEQLRRRDNFAALRSGHNNFGREASNLGYSEALGGEGNYSRGRDYSQRTSSLYKTRSSWNCDSEREERFLPWRKRCRSHDRTRDRERTNSYDRCNSHRFSKERSARRTRTPIRSVRNVRKSCNRCSAEENRRAGSSGKEELSEIDETFAAYEACCSTRYLPRCLGYYEVWANLPIQPYIVDYHHSFPADSL